MVHSIHPQEWNGPDPLENTPAPPARTDDSPASGGQAETARGVTDPQGLARLALGHRSVGRGIRAVTNRPVARPAVGGARARDTTTHAARQTWQG
jgi:hypothetical protein